MAFYIRKAFKAGPLRFNLSKGGIGLSAGVTGARIGVNRRGAYLHGGRHGLYFREQIKTGKNLKPRTRHESVVPGGFAPASVGSERPDSGRQTAFVDASGTVSVYVDTGVLYPSTFADIPTPLWPDFPPKPTWHTWSQKLLLAIFAILLVGSFIWVTVFLPVLAISGVYFGRRFIRHTSNLKAAGHFSRQFMRWMEHPQENEKSILVEYQKYLDQSDADYERYFVPLWYSRLLDRMMALAAGMAGLSAAPGKSALSSAEKKGSRHDKDAMMHNWMALCKQFSVIEQHMDAVKESQKDLKVAMLSDALERTLDDHMLSVEEEAYLNEVVRILNISEQDASAVMQMVQIAADIRAAVAEPLAVQDSPVELTRGEQCVGVFADVRLLRERVLKRYQRERITYRELGYELELEGDLILTDKRVIHRSRGGRTGLPSGKSGGTGGSGLSSGITGGSGLPSGTTGGPALSGQHVIREFRLNRFTDVVADPARNFLELMFSDRQNPVYISSPDSLILASRLEKLMEMSHRTPST